MIKVKKKLVIYLSFFLTFSLPLKGQNEASNDEEAEVDSVVSRMVSGTKNGNDVINRDKNVNVQNKTTKVAQNTDKSSSSSNKEAIKSLEGEESLVESSGSLIEDVRAQVRSDTKTMIEQNTRRKPKFSSPDDIDQNGNKEEAITSSSSSYGGGGRGEDPRGSLADREAGKANKQSITIKNSGVKRQGVRVNKLFPSVLAPLKMAPASSQFGGDDVEIHTSPIFDVVVQMPAPIEETKWSNSEAYQVIKMEGSPEKFYIKQATPVDSPLPSSLHVMDISGEIYTFTLIGTPADIAFEYPKTIIISKKENNKDIIGVSNPSSIIEALSMNDAISMAVDGVPNTGEYDIEMEDKKYQEYHGYAMYSFRLTRKDKGNFSTKNLKYSLWVNEKRFDVHKKHYVMSRRVEWTIGNMLSLKETKIKGYTVTRLFLQVQGGLLEFEDWDSVFILVADDNGYTRFDFEPLRRSYRYNK